MPLRVLERHKSRPKSICVSAEHIFLLEKLDDVGVDTVTLIRNAIIEAGEEREIFAYNADKSPTQEFQKFLEKRGWDNVEPKPIANGRTGKYKPHND